MLIGSRDKQLVLINNGKVETVIKDSYNELKYCVYDGNRIFYTFSNESNVIETYDNRIFNCTFRGKTIQIRDGNTIAEAITENSESGKCDLYERLFARHYYKIHKTELIEHLISQFHGRVVYSGSDFIVDDLFIVDKHGTSHVIEPNGTRPLCLVAQGRLRTMVVKTSLGNMEIDDTLLTIMAKIIFLINPNMSDRVFTAQLPTQTLKILKANESAKL